MPKPWNTSSGSEFPFPPKNILGVKYRARLLKSLHFFFFFALPKPSSAQSRGATRVPCLRVTWYRAMYGSVFHLTYIVCCICSTWLFSSTHLPPRGP